jgi:hypothetical protein
LASALLAQLGTEPVGRRRRVADAQARLADREPGTGEPFAFEAELAAKVPEVRGLKAGLAAAGFEGGWVAA